MNASVKIPKSLTDLLESCACFSRKTEERKTSCRIRVSQKQLWFIAYRAKEATGLPFSCETAHGDHAGHPTVIPVGRWEDGSTAYARCKASAANGPYWVEYTEQLNIR